MNCNCEKENYNKTIFVKKLNANAKIPTRGSAAAAGYDLYADTEENLIEVCRICHTKIHTGEIKI